MSSWLARLSKNLQIAGWAPVPGSTAGAKAAHFKFIDRLVLTLAIEASNRDRDRLTVAFYLAPTFSYPLGGGDCPIEAHRRIGRLINHEEYPALHLPPPRTDLHVDAWWEGHSDEVLSGVLSAITLAEPRFLNQTRLLEGIAKSKTLGDRLLNVRQVLAAFDADERLPVDGLIKMSAKVPVEWYGAALAVLSKGPAEKTMAQRAKPLAEDAWRCRQVGWERSMGKKIG